MFGRTNYEIVDATTRAVGCDNRPIEHDVNLPDESLSIEMTGERTNVFYLITKHFSFLKF